MERLTAASEGKGRGATFTVELPVRGVIDRTCLQSVDCNA